VTNGYKFIDYNTSVGREGAIVLVSTDMVIASDNYRKVSR